MTTPNTTFTTGDPTQNHQKIHKNATEECYGCNDLLTMEILMNFDEEKAILGCGRARLANAGELLVTHLISVCMCSCAVE